MEKFICLVVSMMCIHAVAVGQSDEKYLEGAVPEKEGKVIFSKTFALPGESKDAVFDRMFEWLESRMKSNKNDSRIVLSEKEKGQIVAVGEEYLVFLSNAFTLDRTLMSYNIVILCEAGKGEVRMDKIRYEYEGEKITAENMISDKEAMNKKKTSMYRRNRKFRVQTVDFVEELFDAVKDSLTAQKE